MIDEGYVKFEQHHRAAPPPQPSATANLRAVRDRLHRRSLLGYNAQLNVGFGNVSQRCSPGQKGLFMITATQTGAIYPIRSEHFGVVERFNLAQNQLWSAGPLPVSSESLTHAALYEANPVIRSVLHVHSLKYWEKLRNKFPTTPTGIPYGTPGMAYAVKSLAENWPSAVPRVIVMGGHEEGLLAFGPGPEAAEIALNHALMGW